MKTVRTTCRRCWFLFILLICMPTNVFAGLTKEQAEEVALFATTFIEKGNERRDEKGYPLLVYALSNNWKTSMEIRRSGYLSQLYHVKNNAYHMKNGKYLDLGPKWCMDCGDFISYVYNTTFGLDMYLEEANDPWHIKDIYADANKYANSEYFEFIYKNVPIYELEESKLEKGDIIVRIGSRENHGLIYVGENMQAAHASRNAIKYANNPPILGFEVIKFDNFYKKSTIVSIVRIKDGVIDSEKPVNATITWPDTGKIENLFGIIEPELDLNEEKIEEIMDYMIDEDCLVAKQIDNNILVEKRLIYKSNYLESQVYDWIVYEIRKFILEICNQNLEK